MKKCLILQANQKHKMMKTTVETEEKIDFKAIEDELTPEQRAYWEASIERDLQNPNRGKAHRPIEELRQKMLDALEKHYEKVLC